MTIRNNPICENCGWPRTSSAGLAGPWCCCESMPSADILAQLGFETVNVRVEELKQQDQG